MKNEEDKEINDFMITLFSYSFNRLVREGRGEGEERERVRRERAGFR